MKGTHIKRKEGHPLAVAAFQAAISYAGHPSYIRAAKVQYTAISVISLIAP